MQGSESYSQKKMPVKTMKNENPLVSIVMAAFNEENYLHESINSILEQTYHNFEFIIINDGSTDNSEEIILSFKDPRIIYIKNDSNLKLIESLNKGLKIAKGKYIARMDADDISYTDRLEKQVAFMENNPETGISGAQLSIFGDTNGTMTFPLVHEDIQLYLLITSSFGNNIVIFRRNIMEQNGFLFPKGYLHSEDYKCWTRWIMNTTAANMDDVLVKYRSHSSSVSIRHRSLQRETRNRIRAEYLAELFQLEKGSLIPENFTGSISSARINSIKQIIQLNKEYNYFPSEKLKDTIARLWYLDCLEKVHEDRSILIKFPLIFKVRFKKSIKNWLNLFKHFIKSKRPGS